MKANETNHAVHDCKDAAAARRPLFTFRDLVYLAYLFPLRLLAVFVPIAVWRRSRVLIAAVFRLFTAKQRQFLHTNLNGRLNGHGRSYNVERVSLQFIDNSIAHAIDDLLLNRLSKRRLLNCSQIIGLENFQNALSANRGVILASGHFFGNRVAKRYLSDNGYPVLSVRSMRGADPSMGRFGVRWLQPMYEQFLHSVIKHEVYRDEKDVALRILRHMRNNGIVNVHFDQPAGHSGTECSFLGSPQRFPTGFLRLARFAGAAVIPMSCVGNSESFSITFGEIHPIRESLAAEQNGDARADDISRLIEKLESQIFAHPEHWELWKMRFVNVPVDEAP